jgi:hypothetical protein
MSLFAPVFGALEGSGSRYVIVGGVATVLHGHARLTADVDLIVEFRIEPLTRLLDALSDLGFRPRPPVAIHEFADPARRAEWIRDKGMRVFSLWDPSNPLREVDLFVEHPMDFDELWQRSVEMDIGKTRVRIASIPDLVHSSDLPDGRRTFKISKRWRRSKGAMHPVDDQPGDDWECSFEATRKRQLASGSEATPAQRLAWLEEAIALAHASGALPRRRRADGSLD